MPLRRYSTSYAPYTRRPVSRRSLYMEEEDILHRHHSLEVSDFLKTLYQYPLMKQALSSDLVCYDRIVQEVKEFPYPTDSNGRRIEPSGFNSYFNNHCLGFECFCGFLTENPKFITASCIDKRYVLSCMECCFHISLDAIFKTVTSKHFYLIPKDKNDATKPITSCFIMRQIMTALPCPQKRDTEYHAESTPQSNTEHDYFNQPSSSSAGSSTASPSKVTHWEICPVCDHAYEEGTYSSHLRADCKSPLPTRRSARCVITRMKRVLTPLT